MQPAFMWSQKHLLHAADCPHLWASSPAWPVKAILEVYGLPDWDPNHDESQHEDFSVWLDWFPGLIFHVFTKTVLIDRRKWEYQSKN